MEGAEQSRSFRLLAVVAAAVVLAGIALRIAAATTNLWQDEVWSLWLLGRVTKPSDILTAVHHDNNHPVNSLFLYAVGESRSWLVYRLLSLATGAGSILLAGAIARRWGALEALTAMILFAASFLMVLYSSEARGYMPAVFAALLAFRVFEGSGGRAGGGRDALVFGGAVVLGFLSHLTFLLVYAGLVQWTLARKPTATDFVRWHGIPVACLGALFLLDVRYMQYGGVFEPISLARSLRELVTLPFGLPATGAGAALGTAALLATLGAGLARLRRERDAAWSFYVTCFAALLAVVVGVGLALQIWLVRYGLVAIAFFYLLLSAVLASAYRAGRWGKLAYGLAIVTFCAANGWRSLQLATQGRGGYPQALAYIAARTPDDTVRLGGSDDAGISLLAWFYGPRVSAKRFVYEPRGGAAPPPRWFIQASPDPAMVPEAVLVVSGRRYALERAYDCYTSCSRWFVYGADSS